MDNTTSTNLTTNFENATIPPTAPPVNITPDTPKPKPTTSQTLSPDTPSTKSEATSPDTPAQTTTPTAKPAQTTTPKPKASEFWGLFFERFRENLGFKNN